MSRAEAEAEVRRRNTELEETLASAETTQRELQEEAAALQSEVEALRAQSQDLRAEGEALRAEAEDLRSANQRLVASAGVRAEAEAEMLRRNTELEETLASAETTQKELQEETAALRSEVEALRAEGEALRTEGEALRGEAEAAAERQHQIDDVTKRLRVAEMFLAESEKQRLGATEQLASLRLENEALRERLAAEERAAEPVAAASPPPGTPAEADLMPMVEAWAKAWSEQRVEDYLSFYAGVFDPPDGKSRQEWQSLRRRRLLAPSRIEVGVALLDLEVVAPNRARIEFLQSYNSDRYSDVAVKTLELVLESDRWKIARETSE